MKRVPILSMMMVGKRLPFSSIVLVLLLTLHVSCQMVSGQVSVVMQKILNMNYLPLKVIYMGKLFVLCVARLSNKQEIF